MINKKELYKIYMQNLEDSIIKEIAKIKKISIEKAINIYYNSRFSDLIEKNEKGISFLDYKYLVHEILSL